MAAQKRRRRGRPAEDRIDRRTWWPKIRLEDQRHRNGLGVGEQYINPVEEREAREDDPTYAGEGCWVVVDETVDADGFPDGVEPRSSQPQVTWGGRPMKLRKAVWEAFASDDAKREVALKEANESVPYLIPSLPDPKCARNCVNPWHVKMLTKAQFSALQSQIAAEKRKARKAQESGSRALEWDPGLMIVDVPWVGKMMVRDVADEFVWPAVLKKEFNEDWDFVGKDGTLDWKALEKEFNVTIRTTPDGEFWEGWPDVVRYVEWVVAEKPHILENRRVNFHG